MREYGQVQTSFWSSADAQSFSDNGKLLALYLLTGPHSNGLGCYKLPLGYVVEDLNWDAETVSEGFTELFQTGFSEWCENTKFVFLPAFLRWNPISNPNVAKSRVKEFDAIPKNARFYGELCHSMLAFGNHFGKDFETLLKRLAERYTKQEPTLPNPLPNPREESNPPILVSSNTGGAA